MQNPNSERIAEIQARIQTHQSMMRGYQSVRAATSNQDVVRQAESQIREAQRSISYFQEQIEALQNKRSSSSGAGTPSGNNPQAAQGAAGRIGGGMNRTGSPAPSNTNNGYNQSISSSHSSGSQSSNAMGGGRPPYGDSSSSYTSISSDGGPRRFNDQRPLPGVPSDDSPYGAYGGSEWQPAPMNRAGTSARKNYTNLGK